MCCVCCARAVHHVNDHMLTWAHYRFRCRLIAKAAEYNVCQVIDANEAYTSKTCGACGKLSAVVGSKVFKCRDGECGYVADRDVNAAQNILLRFLTERTTAD